QMRDISELNGEETEPLTEYHERIKVDIAAFMLKRMVGNVTSIKERAEFMNACVAAAATLAAGQSVYLAHAAKESEKRRAIIDTGRDTAVSMVKEAYDEYIAAAFKESKEDQDFYR
ncbi:MAG: hypothetical protein AB3N28_07525, partial [Kordiimonas sp.]